jgi:hypothetical protein
MMACPGMMDDAWGGAWCGGGCLTCDPTIKMAMVAGRRLGSIMSVTGRPRLALIVCGTAAYLRVASAGCRCCHGCPSSPPWA